MFQTFEVTARPEQGPPRLKALRGAMAAAGLAGWIVPRADAWQGEHVAPCDARLEWLTGFTGSAGFAIVLPDEAGLFVDGRYRVQARTQAAEDFTPVDWPEVQPGPWLRERLTGGRVGYDPWLQTAGEIAGLREALRGSGIELAPAPNLIDPLWHDRPAPPTAPFVPRDAALAGEAADHKRARIGAALAEEGDAAVILTLPDSIAWLLNIRGADVARNPVPHAFAILRADGTAQLFCRQGKADGVTGHLGPDVRVRGEGEFLGALDILEGSVRIDPKSAPEIVRARLEAAGVAVREAADPCLLPKARKNAAELSGMVEAHLRDGAAMVRFLAWLDAEAPKGGLTETAVVRALEGFRRDTNALLDISFETICGAGPHGAIVHYRVTEETDRAVRPGELLLVDSGGQYLDGTTDITRTVAVGRVPTGAAEDYTRVLQGMIAVSRARFPRGVGGQHLDALARAPLWSVGRDYDHGTGHGVGVYLSVHEGPVALSRRSSLPLEPGMVLSNEPGHYREGVWGIRIENLLAVTEAEESPGGDPGRKLMGFETLTFVPLDRRLIDTDLLGPEERGWINSYHADTVARIAPLVDGPALDWLTAACAPI